MVGCNGIDRYLLLDAGCWIVERDGMELPKAISAFHNSETFSKLEDFETGL